MATQTGEILTTDERVSRVEARLNELLRAFQLLSKVNAEQKKQLDELKQWKAEFRTPTKQKRRTVNADVANIAFAAWMFNRGYTVRQVEQSGVISYSKAYGITTWDDKYLQEYLKVHNGVEYYEQGSAHPEFNKYVPHWDEVEKKV